MSPSARVAGPVRRAVTDGRRIALLLGSVGTAVGVAFTVADPAARWPSWLLAASAGVLVAWAVVAVRSMRRERDRVTELAEELGASRRRLAEILDGIEDGVTVQGEDGRLVYANRAAAEAIGFRTAEELLAAPPEEILSRFEILDEEGNPFPLDRLPGRRALRGESGAGATLRYRDRRTSGERWSYVRAAPIPGEGAPRLAVNLIQDVTEERWNREASGLLAEFGEDLLASSLDYEGTLRKLVASVVPRLGDVASIYVAEGPMVRRLDVVHADPEAQVQIRRLVQKLGDAIPEGHPVHEVLASGRPQLFPEVKPEMLEALVSDPEGRSVARELDLTSVMILPLIAPGGPIGALALATIGGRRRYDERDLAVALQLAERGAIAVENAALHEQEQRARRRAEETADRMARLHAMTAGLASATTVEEVADAVLDSAAEALGALSGSVVLGDPDDPGVLRLLKSLGLGEQEADRWRTFPVDAPLPLAEAARTGTAVFIEEPHALGAEYPHLVGQAPPQGKAWAAIPLAMEGRLLGAIGLVFPEPREFPLEERRFLEIVGQQCAQALERATLYEAERAARTEAVRQQERLNFLAEASEVLAGSLRYERTLEHLLDLCVPRLADWCIVDVMEADGTIRQLAVAHANPEKAELIRELRRKYPPDFRDHPIPRVIRSGTPEIAAITDETLRANVVDEENLRMLRDLGARGHMVVPLPARGRILGALSFVSGASGRRFTEADLGLAEELARRAALALDNARLYRERSHVAQSLQQSFLPGRLPEIPGTEVAARYRPAGEGSEVGGDFYDVFELSPDRWVVVIGDVSGKGPEAAALTALTRYTIRAAWLESRREPAEILRILNDAILRQGGGRFSTVAVGVLDLSGPPAFTVATGGHPPPLLLHADGSVETVDVRGMLLGVFPDAHVGQGRVEMRPGDAVVLYTDGVVDAGRRSQVPWEQRLAELLRLCVGLDADLIARRLERHSSTFDPGPDDAALVVVRLSPESS